MKTLQRLFFSFLSFFIMVSSVLIPVSSFAANTNGFDDGDVSDRLGLEYGAETGLGSRNIVEVVAGIINVSLGLLGIVFVALLVYAGFLWMTANGNEDNIAKAKKTIFAAVLGLVLILSAFAITQFVFTAGIRATR